LDRHPSDLRPGPGRLVRINHRTRASRNMAMTRKMTKLPAPFALMSSTIGTILVSVTAVWLATSAYAPAARPDAAAPQHYSPGSSSPLFRLSPIPPGATS
jgi:hypothetical protein